jgi:uncharacterized protein YhhL (DUF1145 family)
MRKNVIRIMLAMVLLMTGSAIQVHATTLPAPTPNAAARKLQLGLQFSSLKIAVVARSAIA